MTKTKPTLPPPPASRPPMTAAKRESARNALRRLQMWEHEGWLLPRFDVGQGGLCVANMPQRGLT
jgi:hypothetical protein